FPFTSGTTSGIRGSSRYAADLSMAIAPPRTAWGTSWRDAEVPTENSARSRPPASSVSGVASSTAIPSISLPAEREDAKRRTFSYPRSRSRPTVTVPTAPVAPITPTAASRLAKVERLVQGLHRAVHIGRRDVAGDLDRRGADDRGLDPGRLERGECLRRDAGVALHACADEADLAEAVARRPRGLDRVERAPGG